MPRGSNMSRRELLAELEETRSRLQELEETVRAIRSGEVDALVVSTSRGDQVFTLKGADHPYRVLVEEMSEGAVMLAEDGLIVYCNNGVARMLDAPLERVIGSSIYEWVRPDERSALERLIALHGGSGRRGGFSFQTAAGALVPAYVSVALFRPDEGQPLTCLAVTDLTEQKHDEDVVAEGRLARSILDQAGEGIIVCDERGVVVRASREAERLLGADIVGQEFDAACPLTLADGRGLVLAEAAEARTRGAEATVRVNGETPTVLVSAGPLRGARNEHLGSVITLTDITERKRMEEEIRSVAKFPGENPYPVMRVSADGVLLYANDPGRALAKTWECEPNRALPDELHALASQALASGVTQETEVEAEGRVYSLLLVLIAGEGYVNVYGSDITERKKREAELRQLNRTLKAHIDSSHALMRATDETAYLQEVCRIVVEDCGHAMAWIGYAEDDEAKSVRPVAYAGFEEGYLETLKITWADTERGRGPTGTAVRTGKPSACRNMLTDPNLAPWREEALKRGYASSIVFPLLDGDKAFGAITIYSRHSDPFSEDEVELLVGLASGLAYGITSLRLRAAHAQAGEALRVSDELLRMALKNAKMTVHTVDRELRYTWVYNPPPAFRVEDLIGRTTAEVLPGPGSAKVMDVRRRVIEAGVGERVEVEMDLGGERQAWDYSVEPLRDASGQVTGAIIAAIDITERKQAEEALRETTEFLENLISHASAPIIVWDAAGRITRFNQAFERLTGYQAEEVLGHEVGMLFPEDRREASLREIARALSGERWESVEISILRKDGAVRMALWNSAHIHAPDGTTLQAVIAQGVDITERKRMEDEIRDLNADLVRRVRELRNLNREMESFSYSVSHDLRAPVRRIEGFTQAILEDFGDRLDETAKGYLSRVGAATQHMIQLIDDMLTLSRVTRTEVVIESVNLSEVARSIIEELQAQDPGRQVAVDIAPGIVVNGDRRLLRLMLENLIHNAWKFTRHSSEPRIAFGVVSADIGTVYFVRDNGAGFDMTHAGRLFGAFQRLHTAEEFEGTGIGLATVRRIVHHHGGEVWAEGAQGEGATFYFTVGVPRHGQESGSSR